MSGHAGSHCRLGLPPGKGEGPSSRLRSCWIGLPVNSAEADKGPKCGAGFGPGGVGIESAVCGPWGKVARKSVQSILAARSDSARSAAGWDSAMSAAVSDSVISSSPLEH